MRLVFTVTASLSLLAGMISCSFVSGGTDKDSTDTLRYTYNKAHTIQNDPSITDSSLLFRSTITYPIFEGRNKPLIDSLERFLQFSTFGGYPTAQESTERFVEESIAQTSGEVGLSLQGWVNIDSIAVVTNTPQAVVLKTNHFSYTGGAHGNPSVTYTNFDVPSGKRLTFEDICRDNEAKQLLKVNTEWFRKAKQINPETPLPEAGYFTESDILPLPLSFALTTNGLLMSYNYYEIASYAEGVTTYTIPFSELRSILKDRYLLRK